ncbi:MAG: YtxH domain-containing protein [Bacteroidetes bacterium]|nr:YtxH domain-containing protein [Bacteroidota bacterium]
MQDKRNFFSGFIAGIASCAFVYLYLQSDTGKEMVKDIKEKIHTAGEKLMAMIDELDEQVEDCT